jgi:hypothetical protein
MVGQLINNAMDKRLIVVLIVSVVLNVMFAALWRNAVKSCTGTVVDTSTYDTAMSLLEQQRNKHAQRAQRYEAIADSLLVEIGRWKGKTNKTKIEYVKDLNAWRALPSDARDERVNFFTKELAKVDSIAVW